VSDYYQPLDPRYDFSQGDIIELAPHCRLPHPIVSVDEREAGTYVISSARSKAIAEQRILMGVLITWDCEIEKRPYWHICPIHPLSGLNRSDQTNIRKNKTFPYLHLPGSDQIPESFVDLSSLTTISKDAISDCRRLTTLSDLGKQAFFMQFIRWLTRWTLATVSCPSCNTVFNPADVLPVRAD
jgi:hypothetical protein